MFYEVPCRCGERRKRFKMDIGEFFIDDCCTEKGFDHLGRQKLAEGERVDSVSESERSTLDTLAATFGLKRQEAAPVVSTEKPSSASSLKSLIGLKPGRGKLRDMTRDQLVKLASDKGIEVKEGATKNELIALILA